MSNEQDNFEWCEDMSGHGDELGLVMAVVILAMGLAYAYQTLI